jgi:hypothetical protein
MEDHDAWFKTFPSQKEAAAEMEYLKETEELIPW